MGELHPNIEMTLTVSTENISKETAAWLDAELTHEKTSVMYAAPVVIYEKGNSNTRGLFGWFINVPNFNDTDEDEYAKVPSDLQTLLAMAALLDCIWLMLDRDCDPIPGLTTYNW